MFFTILVKVKRKLYNYHNDSYFRTKDYVSHIKIYTYEDRFNIQSHAMC